MPVQTIECHIATVLMKRFLDGDDLPAEMLDDLERHVKACPGCQTTINNERTTIEEVLDGPESASTGLGGMMAKFGMKTATAGGFATAYPTEALVAAARTHTTTSPGGIAAFKNPKVLLLSAGLAIVLIAMSTVLRDPTLLMGKKASAVVSEASDEGSKGSGDGLGGAEEGSEAPEGTKDAHETPSGEGDHGEKTTEDHGAEGAVDSHGKDLHTTDTGPSKAASIPSEGHKEPETSSGHEDAVSSHATEPTPVAPKTVNGAHVPGEKTIDNKSVILVGPAGVTEHKEAAKKAEVKSAGSGHAGSGGTTHSTPQNAKGSASSHRAPVRRTSSAKKAPAKKAPSKPKSAGIKVYDSNGKPIH